jgi:hypothetical protein
MTDNQTSNWPEGVDPLTLADLQRSLEKEQRDWPAPGVEPSTLELDELIASAHNKGIEHFVYIRIGFTLDLEDRDINLSEEAPRFARRGDMISDNIDGDAVIGFASAEDRHSFLCWCAAFAAEDDKPNA